MTFHKAKISVTPWRSDLLLIVTHPLPAALAATQSPPCLPTTLFLFGQLRTLSSRGHNFFAGFQLREEGLRGTFCREGRLREGGGRRLLFLRPSFAPSLPRPPVFCSLRRRNLTSDKYKCLRLSLSRLSLSFPTEPEPSFLRWPFRSRVVYFFDLRTSKTERRLAATHSAAAGGPASSLSPPPPPPPRCRPPLPLSPD